MFLIMDPTPNGNDEESGGTEGKEDGKICESRKRIGECEKDELHEETIYDTIRATAERPMGMSDDDFANSIVIRVGFPELQHTKCLRFNLIGTVWEAKQHILHSLSRSLPDPLNHGLFQPAHNARAAKFLDDGRLLADYPPPATTAVPFLEFRYKKRVYKHCCLSEKQLTKLHSKANLRRFIMHVRHGNILKMAAMLEKGLDPNLHDPETGETPLTLAAQLAGGSLLLITLRDGGAHLDFLNQRGLTALHISARTHNHDTLETLLDLGAFPDYRDSRGLTPLYHTAIAGGDPCCCEMLLKEQAELGLSDENGWQEIHQVCRYGHARHLEHLLFYGVDMSAQNASGNTAMHICALYNQDSCARVLLYRGASKDVKNFNNQTAFQVAIVAGNFDLADIIHKHHESAVVPFNETPTYTHRRRRSQPVPAPRGTLTRSSSERGLNPLGLPGGLSPPASLRSLPPLCPESSQLPEPRSPNLPCSVGMSGVKGVPNAILLETQGTREANGGKRRVLYRALPNRTFVVVQPHHPTAEGDILLEPGQQVEVLSVGEGGFLEGRVGSWTGWFPADCVEEVQLRSSDQTRVPPERSQKLFRHYTVSSSNVITTGEFNIEERTVVLQKKTGEGFGFVLRGAKADVPIDDFSPSPTFPALQYLESVDEGGVASRAGLRTGDFLIQVNGQDVVKLGHRQVVDMIRQAGDCLALNVVTVTARRPDSETTKSTFAISPTAPPPPKRAPSTALSFRSKSLTAELEELERLDEMLMMETEPNEHCHGNHADAQAATVRPRPLSRRITSAEITSLLERQGSVTSPNLDLVETSGPVIALPPGMTRQKSLGCSEDSPKSVFHSLTQYCSRSPSLTFSPRNSPHPPPSPTLSDAPPPPPFTPPPPPITNRVSRASRIGNGGWRHSSFEPYGAERHRASAFDSPTSPPKIHPSPSHSLLSLSRLSHLSSPPSSPSPPLPPPPPQPILSSYVSYAHLSHSPSLSSPLAALSYVTSSLPLSPPFTSPPCQSPAPSLSSPLAFSTDFCSAFPSPPHPPTPSTISPPFPPSSSPSSPSFSHSPSHLSSPTFPSPPPPLSPPPESPTKAPLISENPYANVGQPDVAALAPTKPLRRRIWEQHHSSDPYLCPLSPVDLGRPHSSFEPSMLSDLPSPNREHSLTRMYGSETPGESPSVTLLDGFRQVTLSPSPSSSPSLSSPDNNGRKELLKIAGDDMSLPEKHQKERNNICESAEDRVGDVIGINFEQVNEQSVEEHFHGFTLENTTRPGVDESDKHEESQVLVEKQNMEQVIMTEGMLQVFQENNGLVVENTKQENNHTANTQIDDCQEMSMENVSIKDEQAMEGHEKTKDLWEEKCVQEKREERRVQETGEERCVQETGEERCVQETGEERCVQEKRAGGLAPDVSVKVDDKEIEKDEEETCGHETDAQTPVNLLDVRKENESQRETQNHEEVKVQVADTVVKMFTNMDVEEVKAEQNIKLSKQEMRMEEVENRIIIMEQSEAEADLNVAKNNVLEERQEEVSETKKEEETKKQEVNEDSSDDKKTKTEQNKEIEDGRSEEVMEMMDQMESSVLQFNQESPVQMVNDEEASRKNEKLAVVLFKDLFLPPNLELTKDLEPQSPLELSEHSATMEIHNTETAVTARVSQEDGEEDFIFTDPLPPPLAFHNGLPFLQRENLLPQMELPPPNMRLEDMEIVPRLHSTDIVAEILLPGDLQLPTASSSEKDVNLDLEKTEQGIISKNKFLESMDSVSSISVDLTVLDTNKDLDHSLTSHPSDKPPVPPKPRLIPATFNRDPLQRSIVTSPPPPPPPPPHSPPPPPPPLPPLAPPLPPLAPPLPLPLPPVPPTQRSFTQRANEVSKPQPSCSRSGATVVSIRQTRLEAGDPRANVMSELTSRLQQLSSAHDMDNMDKRKEGGEHRAVGRDGFPKNIKSPDAGTRSPVGVTSPTRHSSHSSPCHSPNAVTPTVSSQQSPQSSQATLSFNQSSPPPIAPRPPGLRPRPSSLKLYISDSRPRVQSPLSPPTPRSLPSPSSTCISGAPAFGLDRPVKLWTKQEVGEWLESLSLGELRKSFFDHDIDGSLLPVLTREDLMELGVRRVGHRMSLERALRQLLQR